MANGLFGGGDGNPGTPFLVEDGADLNAVRNALGKAYKQVANVNLSGYANWVPIGTLATPFTGVYDGGGFGVSNLNINTTIIHVGLFGYASGIVQGINVLSGSITTTNTHIGAICGYSVNNVSFCSNQGCSVSKTGGTANSATLVGGITGFGNVFDSFNTANVTSTGIRVGGITGGSAATRCYNTGSISTSGTEVFGVCNLTATNCYNSGAVTCTYTSGTSNLFGVCSGTGNDSYNTGVLSSAGSSGNVYGVAGAAATRCYNTTNISCGGIAAGVCSATATDCFNTGSITSTTNVAHGVTFSTATRCYNTGNIRGFTGGFGITQSTANNCYALCDTITRIAGSTATTTWAKVSKTSNTTTNYALDTMTLVYE